MATNIVSKNPFGLLGDESESAPTSPTMEASKPRHTKTQSVTRATTQPKSVAPAHNQAPSKFSGNDKALRDRDVGSQANRNRLNAASLGGSARGRGRGNRGHIHGSMYAKHDRHSRSNVNEHPKQVARSWGGNSGEAELRDEQAGFALASSEKQDEGFVPDTNYTATNSAGYAADTSGNFSSAENCGSGNGEEVNAKNGKDVYNNWDGNDDEPDSGKKRLVIEEPQKSYDEYLAEQAEKKINLGLNTRKTRKVTEENVKLSGHVISRDPEEYFAGSESKPKRHKERKGKSVVELDATNFQEDSRESYRGRGPGRGDRGSRGNRGGGVGDQRDKGERSEHMHRDGERGGNPRGRGRGRGGRPDARSRDELKRNIGDFPNGHRHREVVRGPNVNDEAAFPSLGS